MAEYVIGDVQGCFEPLLRLLDKIKFNETQDRLWFVGDLVNRGPESLNVLRFIKNLPLTPRVVLGNHDLHLLNCIYNHAPPHSSDTFQDILNASDRDDLASWLTHQPLLIHDEALDVIICHAGIYPQWTLQDAKNHAQFFSARLQGEHCPFYLAALYGNQPSSWSQAQSETEQFRFIGNAFTRMRFCNAKGELCLDYKGEVKNAPLYYFPWYATPDRCMITQTIVFGHWAALQGQCPVTNIYAIDTGCVWGKTLTALRLEDKQRLSVPGV